MLQRVRKYLTGNPTYERFEWQKSRGLVARGAPFHIDAATETEAPQENEEEDDQKILLEVDPHELNYLDTSLEQPIPRLNDMESEVRLVLDGTTQTEELDEEKPQVKDACRRKKKKQKNAAVSRSIEAVIHALE